MGTFKVDTDEIAKAKNSMEDKLEEFEKALKNMKISIEELDEVWEGPNHDEFKKNFARRFESMQSYSQMTKRFLDHLGDAVKKYRKCEEDVGSLC
jgi:WXG100 family type VII secretion target